MQCLRCGYDLSHTPATANCPECGLAAHRSILAHVHPDDAPPRWVASIAWATLLLLAVYLFPLLMVGLSRAESTYNLGNRNYIFALFNMGLLVVAALGHAVANIVLSREDRPRALSWKGWLLRWSLRIVPLVPLAGVLLDANLTVLLFRGRGGIRLMHMDTWLTVGNCLIAVIIVCPTLTFFRLRVLAQRLSRPRLAEHIGIVAIGSGVSLVFALVCTLFQETVRHADARFVLLWVLPCTFFLLFTLWSCLLLFLICPRFFRSARHAKARWIAADAARAVPS